MEDFTIIQKSCVPSDCCDNYLKFAFDGCHFYFTLYNQCKILIFDRCLANCREVKTCVPYSNICYDPSEHCFWATTRGTSKMIYKLNACFQEVDCICIDLCKYRRGYIQGLSYDCNTDRIIVAYCDCIIAVSKCCCVEPLIEYCHGESIYTSLVSASPYLITSGILNGSQYILLYDSAGNLLRKNCLPAGFIIRDIVLDPCLETKCQDPCFFVFGMRCGKYPYVLKVCYHNSEYPMELDPCNYYDCKCDHDHPCHPGDCCDIVESIALVEASIAHILNAEGEKLQKVLATTDDIEDILKTNKAVNQTIINATHLEQVLYAKLEAVKEICPDCVCDDNEIC